MVKREDTDKIHKNNSQYLFMLKISACSSHLACLPMRRWPYFKAGDLSDLE